MPCLSLPVTANKPSGCLKTNSSSTIPCLFLLVGNPVPKGVSVEQTGLHPSSNVGITPWRKGSCLLLASCLQLEVGACTHV